MIFKKHIQKMERYQTSLGRDLDHGIRLDRNERVSNFDSINMQDIFNHFKGYSLSASPEASSLYSKLSEYLSFPIENIFITSGITEGIRILYDFCTYPGDNIICLDPTYPMYKIYAEMYGIDYRKFEYDPETLEPKINTLYEQIDNKTQFVIIPNPNLPIESCFTVDEITEILNICKKNNIVLIVDEAYYYWGAPSVTNLLDNHDNLILFRTFSKVYGLAGLRIGYMISNNKIINYVSKSRSIVESNTLSMGIAEYMLDHPNHKNEHIEQVKTGAKFLQKELTNLGIRWFGGNYTNGILIFLRNENQSKELVEYLQKNKIYIRGAFEPPFSATIRVSLGPRESMEKFVFYLKKWLNQLSN